MNMPNSIIVLLSLFWCAQEAHSEMIFTLLTSNTFSGEVTEISVDESVEDIFKGGGIGPGSTFDASFELYDVGEGYGSLYFISEYTFYGFSRNYTFQIDADPYSLNSVWGTLKLFPENRLTASYDNNFNSDGLEKSFHDYGGDYGGFFIELSNYDKPEISGSGNFGWWGFDVYFSVVPSLSVDEPDGLWVLFVGLIAWLARRMTGGRHLKIDGSAG